MSQYTPRNPISLRPHRGTAVLVLGILSIVLQCVGWILGIIAWSMGTNDLRAMDAGVMDPTGRGITQAGKICGMISVILHLLWLALLVLWIVFLGGMAALGAAAAHGR